MASSSENTEVSDLRPNVGRHGLEIVFDSNRPGGLGGTDLYAATRASVDEPWPAPANLADVNSAANESRPSLSPDGSTLWFGSNRPSSEPASDGQPSSDLYSSSRTICWSPAS